MMQRSNRLLSRLAGVLAASVAAAGCAETPALPGPTVQSPGPRICSLSPAISRTCVDFGVGDRIVGRSDFCSFLDPSIPAVGSLFEVDYERLIRLQPTHVLVQPPGGGLDPTLAKLADRHGFTIGQWHLDTIEDIKRLVADLPETLYAPGPQREQARARAAVLRQRIDASLAPDPSGVFGGRTLLVAGIEPLLVFGAQTYLDDVLTALGGTNAVTQRGWVELSLEDVIRLNPEAIVVIVPQEPSEAPQSLGQLEGLEIDAVRSGRVAVVAHPDAHYPSSAVVEVAAAMRRSLSELVAAKAGP